MTVLPVQNITSAVAGSPIMMTNGLVSVTGVFVGTVNIQIDVLGDGNWANCIDPVSGNVIALTAPAAVQINNGIPALTRVNVSAYTSGTISVRMEGS